MRDRARAGVDAGFSAARVPAKSQISWGGLAPGRLGREDAKDFGGGTLQAPRHLVFEAIVARADHLGRACALETMSLVQLLRVVVVFDNPQQKLVVAGSSRRFDGCEQQCVTDALTSRPRMHPEGRHRASTARAGLANRCHSDRKAI